jgi:hypothetical protein
MSNVSQGPGWWQASDLKWYPPESQPNYAAPAPPPRQPSQPAHPAPYPPNQAAGAQMASEGLAAAKSWLANLSVTAWLLVGGSVAAAISLFLPWRTVTATLVLMGKSAYTGPTEFGLVWGGKLIFLALIVAAVWLAWPVFAGITISVKRLAVLSAAVGLMLVSIPMLMVGIKEKPLFVNAVSYGFGFYLFVAAVIAIAAGVVRLWIQRSKTQAG